MTEAQLPPLGAEVELLIQHCCELDRRFSNRSDDTSYILCIAWIQRCAKRILESLPQRREFVEHFQARARLHRDAREARQGSPDSA